MKLPVALVLTAVVASGVTACSWVKPSTASQKVVLANASEVGGCVKKGSTDSKTLGKFLFIPRGKEKVFTELVTLAKNEAVVLGGDTVVPEGGAQDGKQTFSIYKCR